MNRLTRPTLIVDKTICRNNIQRMAEKTRDLRMRFRPHFKTHQSATIGEWFREFGIECITVSSTQMAAYFATHGWKDITIAFPLNIHEIGEINRLASSIKLNVLIENKDTATELAKRAQEKLGVFIEIDTGHNRTGIAPARTALIDGILEELKKNSKLQFVGFLTHTGQTYNARSVNEIFSSHFDALLKLRNLKRRYEKEFPKLEISLGDTPSASLCTNFSEVDEIRPGNFVFYDLMQHSLGACKMEDIAIRVHCPVVAKHISRNEITIYGGAVHFSKDTIRNTDGKEMYGRIIIERNGEKILLDNFNYLARMSQEHGILKVTTSTFREIQIGDWLEIIPVHSCLTANLMGHMLTSDGEPISMMPKY